MNNRTLIGLGAGLGVLAIAALFAAILIANTHSTAQQVSQPAATTDTPAPSAPAGAAARTPVILVVDRNAILRQSAAGRDLIKQVDDLGKQMEAKYGDEEKKLRSDAQALQEQAGVLSPDARQKKEKDIRDRGEALQKKVQDEQASIQNGINIARTQIETALGPILKSIFDERGATIMLDHSAIVLGSNDIEVTPQVIQRLDQVLPSVKVVPKKPEAGADGQPRPQGQ